MSKDTCPTFLTLPTDSQEKDNKEESVISIRGSEVDRSGRACRAASCSDSEKSAQPDIPTGRHQSGENEQTARLLELTTAQRDALAHTLHAVLYHFRRELGAGYSTAEAQQALREARALLAEVGL